MSVWQWSTTAGSNNTADANINWQEGQLPSTVNDSARAMMAALKAFVQDGGGFATLGGVGDAFTLTLTQPVTTRVAGQIGFFATRTNTGAVTMNVDGTGASPLRTVSGTALTAGKIIPGCFYIITWNSATSEWILTGKLAIEMADFAAIADKTFVANNYGASAAPQAVTAANAAALLAGQAPQYYPPTGMIAPFGMGAAPTGWLACDGTAVSRATYAPLFTAIGTTWGVGDNATTFNVPDLRGGFLRGSGVGLNPANRAVGSYEADGNKAHTHTITDPGHNHAVQLAIGNQNDGYFPGGPSAAPVNTSSTTTTTKTTGITVDSSGGTETVPKNFAVFYCIKT